MKLIIDRFEGSFAVCEREDLSHVRVEAGLLPDGAKEGSVIDFSDGVYTIDEAETLKRRQTVSKKLRRLFGN